MNGDRWNVREGRWEWDGNYRREILSPDYGVELNDLTSPIRQIENQVLENEQRYIAEMFMKEGISLKWLAENNSKVTTDELNNLTNYYIDGDFIFRIYICVEQQWIGERYWPSLIMDCKYDKEEYQGEMIEEKEGVGKRCTERSM